MMKCLICQGSNLQVWDVSANPKRTYFKCEQCDYLFMDPEQRWSEEQEVERYRLHQNQVTDGYLKFFEPLIVEIEKYRKPHQIKALDFGCGPEPVLAELLKQKSWKTTFYDPLFFPDQNVLKNKYDLVTSTEVWEHLYQPIAVLDQLQDLLSSSALLAVMTSSPPNQEEFSSWSYRRDMTHVGFFSEKAMKFIAQRYGWEILFSKSPYWMLHKP